MLYTEEAIAIRKTKMQKVKSVLSIVAYIILIPLLTYNISLIVQAVKNPDKTPSFLGIKTYVIISGSMEPELNIGDIVLVKEIKKEDIREGDIISFRQGQTVITHRILEIISGDKTEYKTKGDNNNVEDTENIEYEQIEGIVTTKIPALGKLTLILQGKILLLVIIILIYIYISRVSSINNRRNKRKIKRLKYEENKIKENGQ